MSAGQNGCPDNLSRLMPDSRRVLPMMQDLTNNLVNPNAVLHLGENKWTVAAHSLCVVFHYLQIRTNSCGQIGLVDDEQVALGDAGSVLARNLVPVAA